jgi:HPt (histidine-containing phosphotransfer) domain-containing protein
MIPLDEIAAELGLEEEDVLEFLNDFLEHTEHEDLAALRPALRNGDFAEVRKRAHSIKGAALNLKLAEIGRCAQQIELSSKEPDPQGLESLVEAIDQEMRLLRAWLEQRQA